MPVSLNKVYFSSAKIHRVFQVCLQRNFFLLFVFSSRVLLTLVLFDMCDMFDLCQLRLFRKIVRYHHAPCKSFQKNRIVFFRVLDTPLGPSTKDFISFNIIALKVLFFMFFLSLAIFTYLYYIFVATGEDSFLKIKEAQPQSSGFQSVNPSYKFGPEVCL